MTKKHVWFYLALLISSVVLVGCGPAAFQIEFVPTCQQLKETEMQREKSLFAFDRIAVIDVDGLLTNKRKHGWMRDKKYFMLNLQAFYSFSPANYRVLDSFCAADICRANAPMRT